MSVTSDDLYFKMEKMESRMSRIEESVNKIHKILLRNDNAQFTRQSCTPGLTTSPPSSPLEMAMLGDADGLRRLLQTHGAKTLILSQLTLNGDSVLHVAAGHGHLQAVIAILEVIEFTVLLNSSTHRGRTPLHCAANEGHLGVVERLLNAGATIDELDEDGATPLILAAEKGFTDVVYLLLHRGAQPKLSISSAVSKGQLRTVKFLLRQNYVSPNACNEKGETLLVQAAESERWEMVELLLDSGASPTKSNDPRKCALMLASKSGHQGAVRQILRAGAAFNQEQVKLALSVAKTARVVSCFIAVPSVIRGPAGVFGMVAAGADGRLGTMVALLDSGVGVDVYTLLRRTALWHAAANGHVECVRELLDRGALVDACDENGDTPLHRASFFARLKCVRELLDAGANVSLKNKQGKTPLDITKVEDVRRMIVEK